MGLDSLSETERIELFNLAQKAVQGAYAPYSNFRVGAAVLTEKGNLFSGCNIENVSYSLTICAERVAIFSALANEGSEKMRVRAIAVANERGIECSPCGACRQVISEFGKNATVLFQGSGGIVEMSASDLLPRSFESYG